MGKNTEEEELTSRDTIRIGLVHAIDQSQAIARCNGVDRMIQLSFDVKLPVLGFSRFCAVNIEPIALSCPFSRIISAHPIPDQTARAHDDTRELRQSTKRVKKLRNKDHVRPRLDKCDSPSFHPFQTIELKMLTSIITYEVAGLRIFS